MRGPPLVQALLASNDGRRLLAVTTLGKAQVFAADGTRVGPALRATRATAAALTGDGRRVAVGGKDGRLRVVRLPDGRPQVTRQDLPAVQTVAFDRTGRRVLTVGDDWSVRVWDARPVGAAGRPPGPRDRLVSAEFSPDGRFVLTAGADGSARLWDPALETTVLRLPVGGGAAFSPDGAQIAVGGVGTVEVDRCTVCGSVSQLERLARSRLPR